MLQAKRRTESALNSANTHVANDVEVTYPRLVKTLREFGIGFPQNEFEFQELLKMVVQLEPRTFVEIGTRDGGSLWMIAQYLPLGATIVSIDLAGAPWGRSSSQSRKECIAEELRGQGFQIHLLELNSHEESTVACLKDLLGERPIDFLFIDGDHSWEGVLDDWRMYHSLVRPKGGIAFHDIVRSKRTPKVKVWILWEVLKTIYPHREFIANSDKGYGIGWLWRV